MDALDEMRRQLLDLKKRMRQTEAVVAGLSNPEDAVSVDEGEVKNSQQEDPV